MQNRDATTGINGSSGRSRAKTSSGFWSINLTKLALATILLNLCSCSTYQKTNKLELAELSSKICLAGEGKGRWKSAKSKYIFSFESEVSWKDRNWLLIGSLPVYGEEFVKLSWENEFRDVNIEGSLYKKFLNDPASERRSNHNSKKSLDEFLLEWLKLSSKLMNSPNDFVASPDDWRVERVEDGVMLWRKLTNGEVFRWKSSRLADKFFTKSELSLHRAQDSKLLNLFKLTLFYSDCHTAQ